VLTALRNAAAKGEATGTTFFVLLTVGSSASGWKIDGSSLAYPTSRRW
jgi:hypothetical protein